MHGRWQFKRCALNTNKYVGCTPFAQMTERRKKHYSYAVPKQQNSQLNQFTFQMVSKIEPINTRFYELAHQRTLRFQQQKVQRNFVPRSFNTMIRSRFIWPAFFTDSIGAGLAMYSVLAVGDLNVRDQWHCGSLRNCFLLSLRDAAK